MNGIVTLLTDFGTSDHYVAAVKGVLLSINPSLNIVDITHDVFATSASMTSPNTTGTCSTTRERTRSSKRPPRF